MPTAKYLHPQARKPEAENSAASSPKKNAAAEAAASLMKVVQER
jgi:hypothetical protein